MKGQELKDFVKSNHKDFGGSMTSAEIAKHCEVSNARVSQIKGEITSKKTLDAISAAGQEMAAAAA